MSDRLPVIIFGYSSFQTSKHLTNINDMLFYAGGVFHITKFLRKLQLLNIAMEPKAIFSNCLKSPLESGTEPSAMFEVIDIADRHICEVIPYISSFGNCFVT